MLHFIISHTFTTISHIRIPKLSSFLSFDIFFLLVMNRLRKLLMKEEDNAITTNRRRALMVAAASSHIQLMQEEESKWGGSSEGHKYVPRRREMMDERLKELYFTSPCRYEPNIFLRRYRMQPWVFDRMMRDVANHDPYFVQKKDGLGRVRFSTEQKLTCAMRMLAYGISAYFCDNFLDIAKSMACEILEHFTRAIWNVYHKEYLRRPNKADLRRLLDKAASKGFPGMVGSLDCMH